MKHEELMTSVRDAIKFCGYNYILGKRRHEILKQQKKTNLDGPNIDDLFEYTDESEVYPLFPEHHEMIILEYKSSNTSNHVLVGAVGQTLLYYITTHIPTYLVISANQYMGLREFFNYSPCGIITYHEGWKPRLALTLPKECPPL